MKSPVPNGTGSPYSFAPRIAGDQPVDMISQRHAAGMRNMEALDAAAAKDAIAFAMRRLDCPSTFRLVSATSPRFARPPATDHAAGDRGTCIVDTPIRPQGRKGGQGGLAPPRTCPRPFVTFRGLKGPRPAHGRRGSRRTRHRATPGSGRSVVPAMDRRTGSIGGPSRKAGLAAIHGQPGPASMPDPCPRARPGELETRLGPYGEAGLRRRAA